MVTTPMVEKGAARRAAPRRPVAPVVAAALLVVAGGFLFREALIQIDDRGTLLSGPRLAPLVVSGGWFVIAVAYLTQGVRRHRSMPTGAAEPVQEAPAAASGEAEPATAQAEAAPRAWATPSLLVGALVAYILLLDVLGFIVASGVFVVGAARILGSRRLLRDIVVAAGLAPTIYLGFTRLLDIRLPEGVLPL